MINAHIILIMSIHKKKYVCSFQPSFIGFIFHHILYTFIFESFHTMHHHYASVFFFCTAYQVNVNFKCMFHYWICLSIYSLCWLKFFMSGICLFFLHFIIVVFSMEEYIMNARKIHKIGWMIKQQGTQNTLECVKKVRQ